MRSTTREITVRFATDVWATLEVNWRAAEGEAWEPFAVTWAELVAWPDDDQGQRFMPHELTPPLKSHWLRWLRETDPESCYVDYGTKNQKPMRVQDAVEEAWLEDVADAGATVAERNWELAEKR